MIGRLRRFFCKLWQSAIAWQKRVTSSASLCVILEIRYDRLDESSLKALHNYVGLLQRLGYQVQERKLSIKIPHEYIGVESCWCGGRLESRRYLMIQEECVCRKILLAGLPDSGGRPIVLSDSDDCAVPLYYFPF